MLIAAGVSLVLFACPFLVGPRLGPGDHGLLSLLMLGVAASFVHGFGYVPEHRVLRLLFSPAVAWPGTFGALALLLR